MCHVEYPICSVRFYQLILYIFSLICYLFIFLPLQAFYGRTYAEVVSTPCKAQCISSWIYENVLSENMSSLTRILLNRAFNRSNGPKTNEEEGKEGKEKAKKKTEHSYVFVLST